jgi:hypothetical protein
LAMLALTLAMSALTLAMLGGSASWKPAFSSGVARRYAEPRPAPLARVCNPCAMIYLIISLFYTHGLQIRASGENFTRTDYKSARAGCKLEACF